ncbi:ATP-binding protein [Actinoplanes sp. CA-015351]|uniref:ATP-binding protein n=1 Tax=Actinoplanes sp. CA-015351 TaxID=3239897 RepID=UPI003D959B3E
MPRPFPLVGRDDALTVLDGALTAAEASEGGCVVIDGPAGIGKTRLLTAATTAAGTRGIAVAAGRATELDRVAPLTTLLAALRGSEPAVLDESRMAGLTRHQDAKFWVLDQLCERLERYCRNRSLVIAVDDVQWVDELTALALRVMVPALRSVPLLWLLSRRSQTARTPAAATVDWLIGEGAQVINLQPLGPSPTAELCANVLGHHPGPGLLRLAEGAGGNPFLIEELLTTLRRAGRIRTTGGSAEVTDGPLPTDFVATVERRLGELPGEVRRLLEAGAVLGRPFTLHEAAGLLARPTVELLDATRAAVDADALVDSGTSLWFRHNLIREAVYDGLPGSARQALHREAVTVLKTEGRPAAEIAEHFVHGAQQVGPQSLRLLRTAVDEVAHSAPGAAADLILRTLDLLRGDDPGRLQLIADAIRLLASAGRLGEAQKLGDIYLSCGLSAPDEAAILLGLAEALKHAGHDREVVALTQRALCREGVPTHDHAHLLGVQAHGMLQLGELDEAQSAAARAVELGRLAGIHPAVVVGDVASSAAAYARGDLNLALRHADEAVTLADRVRGEASHRHPRLWLGRALVALDRTDRAQHVYEADRQIAEQLGTVWSQPLSQLFQADLLLSTGQLGDAEAAAEAGLLAAEQLGATACAPALLATLAHLAVRREDGEAARRHLDRARLYLDSGVCATDEEVGWETALYHDADGRPADAYEAIRGIYPALDERPYLLVQEPLAAAYLIRFALAVGAREQAQMVVDAARAAAGRNPGVASLAGAALHAHGLLHNDLDALRASVTAYRISPRPLCRASACEDLAAAERLRGDAAAAPGLLDQALSLYAESGAQRDAQRVQSRLRRTRSRRPAGQVAARRPKSGWASLTESELRVARLVAQGRTNREVAAQLFLSRHTVDSHIRHAFAKLRVSSRVELARLVLENDREAVSPAVSPAVR